ncbi:CxxC motif protein [Halorubrum phage Hardycor1]|nr:CxxC motif protein [Halorubrum phage Hardycor1]
MTNDTTHYRNEPANSFEAHLFDADEVESAGGGDGEKSERPAASVCSRTTAYGPFHEVADDEDLDANGGTCGVCVAVVTDDEDGGDA